MKAYISSQKSVALLDFTEAFMMPKGPMVVILESSSLFDDK